MTVGILEPRCLLSGFVQTNLDSDLPGLAAVTDPNLRNPWGISMSPIGPFWFGDNAAGVSDLVDGGGHIVPLVVTTPGPGGVTGLPTGTLFNGSSGFVVSAHGKAGPALFLFAGEDGTISGWQPAVDATRAIVMIGGTQDPIHPTAVFKGLALAERGGQPFLYATDFRAGTVDVFDQDFHPVQVPGGFADANIPTGFAPFGIQTSGSQIFVTYARQDAERYDDVPGAGNGFVDVFNPDGQLIHRLVSGGVLNSPWGITLAPADFGPFSHDLLVGNAGDGRIHAFDPTTGQLRGVLADVQGHALVNGRLWALTFGNGHEGGATDTLYFAAGIGNEEHGLFGMIEPADRPGAGQIPGADQGASGSNPYDPTSDDDDYPLPPAQGPGLTSDAGQQPALVAVLMPLQDHSIALAPTLLTPPLATPAQNAPASQTPAPTATALASLAPTALLSSSLLIVADGTDSMGQTDDGAAEPLSSLASLFSLDSDGEAAPVAPEAPSAPTVAAASPDPVRAAHAGEAQPLTAALPPLASERGADHLDIALQQNAPEADPNPECLEAASVGQMLVELIETETGCGWKPIVGVLLSMTAAGYLWRRRTSWRPLTAPILAESTSGQSTLPVKV